jgi:hypothetical protein
LKGFNQSCLSHRENVNNLHWVFSINRLSYSLYSYALRTTWSFMYIFYKLLTWLCACHYETQWVESIQFKITFLDGLSPHTYCG